MLKLLLLCNKPLKIKSPKINIVLCYGFSWSRIQEGLDWDRVAVVRTEIWSDSIAVG